MRILFIIMIIMIIMFSADSVAVTTVCFSPSTCCEDNIVELIDNSQENINIAIYALTNQKIYDALIKAKERGVDIMVVADKTQSKGKNSLIPKMKDDGFNVRIHKKVRIEHNKFGIFDHKFLIIGSYNWTDSATKVNSENCLVDKRKKIIKKYNQRFSELWEMYE